MKRRLLRKWWNNRWFGYSHIINLHYRQFCCRKLTELGIMYKFEPGKCYNGLFDSDRYYKLIGDDDKRRKRILLKNH